MKRGESMYYVTIKSKKSPVVDIFKFLYKTKEEAVAGALAQKRDIDARYNDYCIASVYDANDRLVFRYGIPKGIKKYESIIEEFKNELYSDLRYSILLKDGYTFRGGGKFRGYSTVRLAIEDLSRVQPTEC